MRERIILAPGANGSELIKSLAMHGVNCFNLRIAGSGELARMAMMRSGIAITEDFVSRREEAAIVAEAVKGDAYFTKPTYSDIKGIADAIRRMRSLIPDDNEEEKLEDTMKKGIFTAKNSALISVYKKFKKLISERNLIDSVSLIRKAVLGCNAIDADFFTLEEYPLSPLDKALLNNVSGGNSKEISLASLFGAEGNPFQIKSIKNCYGAPNEVETILTDIYSGKNLDTCTVAVTDPGTYGQIFFDYALLYDMPITFGCGIPIMNSNPARLLVLYYKWMTGGFFGAFSLNEMLSSNAFDSSKLYELYPEADKDFSWSTYKGMLDGIRFTNDADVNSRRLSDLKKALSEEEALVDASDEKAVKDFSKKKLCIPHLEVMAKELSLPAEEFISKFAYIRKGSETNSQKLLMMLDMSAASAIYEELKVIRSSGVDQDEEDMILNVLKIGVASGRSEEGKLFVTTVDGALSSIRKNVYIAGLSATNYPGSNRQNYLLLDADIRLFGDDAEYMTSDGKITQKRKKLLTLAELSSNLGSEINVSYAGLNVSELKRDNASSLVFELYSKECGRNATSKELEEKVQKIGYFEPAISKSRKVGEAYNEGKVVTQSNTGDVRDTVDISWNLDREYSPSALEDFFGCQLKFMYKRILGIPEPDEDDPFSVIAANDIGTLAHSLMESLANSTMSKDDFLALSGEYFDRFLLEHPPLVKQKADAEREEFLDMMGISYDMDPQRQVVLKEEDIHCTHESGVKIHGFPDRVEKLNDGSYLIVDFKSKRKLEHMPDDIETCLQVVIYAYLMESRGFKVSGGEYRYIRLGEPPVTCKYDKEMKDALNKKLEYFKDRMEKARFPASGLDIDKSPNSPDACKYCAYGMICRKGDEEVSEDE